MLAHVSRTELLTLATQTAKAAPKIAGAEKTQGIHVEVDSRRSMITLTATNYEIAIRASMGASVEQPGSVIVNPNLFPAILTRLPEENVDLEVENGSRLVIRSGQSSFRLSVLSGEKYPMPDLPFPDDTLPVSGLCSLARSTVFAAAEENGQSPQMKCVRLQIGPDGLKACSSNGFCIVEADGDKRCKGKTELLLPARSLKTLASISKDSDVYEMGVTGKSLVFWSGTLLFSARLVDGRFPDTTGIFNQFKCQYSARLDATEFRHALETVAAVTDASHRFELVLGEHTVILSATSDCGKSTTPVRALIPSAPGKPFYYNCKKLLEYLNLERDQITLEFDKTGILAINSGTTRYLQSPLRPPTCSVSSGKAA